MRTTTHTVGGYEADAAGQLVSEQRASPDEQAAVLAELCKDVYSIEIIDALQ